MLVPRNLKKSLLESASDTPVVMLNGARQTGKSTLIKALFSNSDAPEYISLDDLGILDAARNDPQSFVTGLADRVIIDEIQRVPELMLSIKYSVDKNRLPGRFFLTGSADVMALPKVADTLAGRIEIQTLWTLSQGELRGKRESFVDALFDSQKLKTASIELRDIVELMCVGGYPDVVKRDSWARRKSWFASYIKTLIERDVRNLRNIEQLTQMPKLLQLVASRSGGLLNYSTLARSLEMKQTTLKTYLALLDRLFLTVPLEPWFSNLGKRLVKSPKLYLNDTGLLCHLIGRDAKAISRDGSLLGMVFENFVFMELKKQIGWSKTSPKIYHFRTENGEEVDFVLEADDGSIVGIECKANSSAGGASRGLEKLKEIAGDKYRRGIVVYLGSKIIALSQDTTAVPVSTLWETSSGAALALTNY